MDGKIIEIERFSLHDGPGIRATLFLKGCGLRCAWCQNPEGMEPCLGLWYLGKQCIRCRSCAPVCPRGAIALDDEYEPFVRIDRAACDLCGACVAACPTGALAFDGRSISAAEAAEALLRDLEFYRQTGGGITISGGDPLVQHDFALEVLALCRGAGVHTAVETCLYGDFSVLERFLPLVDLFIVDLKLADDAMHREYTRRSNEGIKANYAGLVRALAAERPSARLPSGLLTRIPLIPRVTATAANVSALARFVAAENPGGRVELVNYNPLAPGKYALMNRSVEFFAGMERLPEADVEALRALLEAEGLAAARERPREAWDGRLS